jgi:hypothetical protein
MGVKWRWETDARDRRAAGDERQRPPNEKTTPRAAPTQRARGSGTRAEDARQPRFSGGESRRPNNRNGTTIKKLYGATKKNQELSTPLIPFISLSEPRNDDSIVQNSYIITHSLSYINRLKSIYHNQTTTLDQELNRVGHH